MKQESAEPCKRHLLSRRRESPGFSRGENVNGSVCESCRVNPEVYGETGSGIACLNSAECGYRYCD